MVSESEAHACLVCRGVGVWWGDEILDGGTHVVGQFREEGVGLGFREGTHREVGKEVERLLQVCRMSMIW